MKPKLLLLTGTAAGEVAEVFREMALGVCAANRDGECFQPGCPQLRDGEPRKSGRSCPVPWPSDCDEGEEASPTWDEVRDYWEAPEAICKAAGGVAVEKTIRSLPGGEAWLVGLVFKRNGLPARLAILAPDPPPLLVERVRAWGGEVWICIYEAEAADGRPCCIYNAAWPDEPRDADTWLEAVRAALGEGL